MALMKRTAADALKAADAAERKAADLEAKAAEATATAQRMDAEATDALVSNPGQAERITAGITAQERLARAYRVKADAARASVDEHYQEALELEATELDREADKLDREADKLAERVTAALKALEDVDGYAWERKPLEFDSISKVPTSWSVDGAAGDKRGEAEAVRFKALHNRYWIKHGQPAQFVANLRDDSTTVAAMWDNGPAIDPERHTSVLLAQIASGNVPADVEA